MKLAYFIAFKCEIALYNKVLFYKVMHNALVAIKHLYIHYTIEQV